MQKLKNLIFAPVAELADAYGSGPYFFTEVQVQVLSGAPQFKEMLLTLVFLFIFNNLYSRSFSMKESKL